MGSFAALGIHTRNELAMRRICPTGEPVYAEMEAAELRRSLRAELPLWVHNIITDEGFPRREQLMMPLRRFEGELLDRKHDDVVSMVLSHGFRNQSFDPRHLPADMGIKERCAIVAHIQPWNDAYEAMENDLLGILCSSAAQLDSWVALARQPEFSVVD